VPDGIFQFKGGHEDTDDRHVACLPL
jgi:hypothetical protein